MSPPYLGKWRKTSVSGLLLPSHGQQTYNNERNLTHHKSRHLENAKRAKQNENIRFNEA